MHKFKIGDIVVANKQRTTSNYKKGTLAVVRNLPRFNKQLQCILLDVEWLPNQLDKKKRPLKQMHGEYYAEDFELYKKSKFLI